MEVPLDLKVTVPVGVGPPAAVTVAVNVTACPPVDGLVEEVSAVVVAFVVTVMTPELYQNPPPA